MFKVQGSKLKTENKSKIKNLFVHWFWVFKT